MSNQRKADEMRTIFGDPIQHPYAKCSAYVGAFASDYLGDFDTPKKAAKFAREHDYRIVHVMYRDGKADAIDTGKS